MCMAICTRLSMTNNRLQSNLDTTSYALGLLTAGGGIAGFARTGSLPSIVAGCTVGLLCTESTTPLSSAVPLCPTSITDACADGLGGYRIQNREPYGVELSLLASVVLGGSSIPRAIRLRKPVPIALSVLSTVGLVIFGDTFRRSL